MTVDLPSVTADTFRTAMRSPANAVAIITGGRPGERVGVTVTAVCSLSDTPPMVLACLYAGSSALPVLRRAGAFCLNYLSRDHADLAGVFAGRGELRGEDRFHNDFWRTGPTGAPVLRGALASFDCVLEQEIDSATHAILVGRVVDITTATDPAPLVYGQGNFAEIVPIAS